MPTSDKHANWSHEEAGFLVMQVTAGKALTLSELFALARSKRRTITPGAVGG